jgi:hypothetical protein
MTMPRPQNCSAAHQTHQRCRARSGNDRFRIGTARITHPRHCCATHSIDRVRFTTHKGKQVARVLFRSLLREAAVFASSLPGLVSGAACPDGGDVGAGTVCSIHATSSVYVQRPRRPPRETNPSFSLSARFPAGSSGRADGRVAPASFPRQRRGDYCAGTPGRNPSGSCPPAGCQ